ncbi:exportin-5 isoform X3 [Nematostella vectensis]|uniref:exportin-5 isoform X3 n=1 Tax=Nematostella vectensis TaxID=45351 RepID=UPI00207752E9|nr:exportin-5 isoform X3 [Nematostella vectensis]
MATSSEEEAKLIKAIEVTLEPAVPAQLRTEAYEFIENFKNNLERCLTTGFRLFSKENSAMVRHIGLQLMEHSVKFNWGSMQQNDCAVFKQRVMSLLVNGTKPMSEEPYHLKESLARLVAEVAKREWPQSWENFLSDLNGMCPLGKTQQELVLMVLLRLAEDVIGMDVNLQNQRKREMMLALNTHSEGIFKFFLNMLTYNSKMLNQMRENPALLQEMAECKRIAEQTLATMHGYLEWVKPQVLFQGDCVLFHTLYNLLADEDLKLPACECLLIIVNRKAGKGPERQIFLEEYSRFFCDDAIQVMLSTARKAASIEFDEKQYLFLKRLCQVLTSLGLVQLPQIWNQEKPDGKPKNFNHFIEILLAFSQHESLAIAHLTFHLWLKFLNSEVMVKDENIQSSMLHLLELAKTKTLRAGKTESSDIPGGIFNQEDFNSEKEFNSIFSGVRSQIMDILRQITLHFPVEAFMRPAEWLLQNIEKTKLHGLTGQSKLIDQLIVQWDGVWCYMDAVMTTLFKVDNINEILCKEIPFRGESGNTIKFLDLGRFCIESLIQVDPTNCKSPHILADAVEMMKSLMPFLAHAQDLILNVLTYILQFITFNTTGDPKPPWSSDVLHTRRIASSAVLCMCKSYGHLLVSLFAELKSYVYSLFDSDVITVQDRSNLTEAIVIASNHITDTNTRNQFLEELMMPFKTLITTEKFRSLGGSAEVLVVYLGMNQDPSTYSLSDEIRQRRFELMVGLVTTLAVTRQAKAFDSVQACDSAKGCTGFMPGDPVTDAAANPAQSHLLQGLPYLLLLTQSINEMYGPAGKAAMHPGYLPAMGLHETERCAIFVLESQEDSSRSTLPEDDATSKTKTFIFYLTENIYNILGRIGVLQLYSQPSLAEYIIQHVINTLYHVPNYRLRLIMRHFLRAYIINCPAEYYQLAIVPILVHFIRYMLTYLDSEWQKVKARQNESAPTGNDQDTESMEVIEDQLVHMITKDYMDLFTLALTKRVKDTSGASAPVPTSGEDDTEMEQDDEGKPQKVSTEDAVLGPLGDDLLENQFVSEHVLYTVFSAITWLDSTACNKACRLVVPVVTKIMALTEAKNSPIAQPVIEQLFLQIIRQPKYPTVAQVLQQATGSPPQLVQQFHDSIFSDKKLGTKKQRDLFKKVVEPIIGKHIGQMFKNEIKIKDLPSIPVPPKSVPLSLGELDGAMGLTDLFDPKKSQDIL